MELPGVYMSGALLTPELAGAYWRLGFRVLSQQLWTGIGQPENRVINLRNALNAGMKIVGPIAITGGTPGAWHVDQARAGVPADLWAALALTPIDVELAGIQNSEVGDALDDALALGKRRCVYASEGSWGVQGNPTFANCLTYRAAYDGVPHLAPPLEGLGPAVGKQYTNTQQAPVSVCFEVWDEALLTGEDVAAALVALHAAWERQWTAIAQNGTVAEAVALAGYWSDLVKR